MVRLTAFARYLVSVLLPGLAALSAQIAFEIVIALGSIPHWLLPFRYFVGFVVFVGSGFLGFRRYEKQLTLEFFDQFRRFFEDFYDFSLRTKGEHEQIKPTGWISHLDPNKLPGNGVQLWRRNVENAESILRMWGRCLEQRVARAGTAISRFSLEDMRDLVTEFRWIAGHHYDYVVQEAIKLANKVQMTEQPTEHEKKFLAYRERYNSFVYDFNKYVRLLKEKLGIALSELRTIDENVEFYGPERRD